MAAVCRRLEGLLLALELAAPWLRVLTAEDLLVRLERRQELLVGGAVDLPERQRTMRATLAWSCELLAPAQRALPARLSVFAGGVPLEGIEQVSGEVAGTAEGALGDLSVLAQHSLVQRQESAAGRPRVTMLETAREYGREQLDAAGEAEAARRAHATYYPGLSETADHEIRGVGQGPRLDRLSAELDNMRAALRWSRGLCRSRSAIAGIAHAADRGRRAPSIRDPLAP